MSLSVRSFFTRVPNLRTLRFLSSKLPQQGVVKEVDPETGELKTKKTNIIPKITLLTGDSVSVSTLSEAEKIAKRRDLKLVKIIDFDTKSKRPVYKLMTGNEYFAEDLKKREQKRKERQQKQIKGEKVLLINSKIAQHDLDIQMRKAEKWLAKMYEVRVFISGANSNLETSEKVYSAFQNFFKEFSNARILAKTAKGYDIKFQIVPNFKSDGDDL